MNENAKKWIAALRSGEYRQTRDVLRSHDGYCCLGVACDVYAEETGKGEWKKKSDSVSDFFFKHEYGRETTELPCDVASWLGLPRENKVAGYNSQGCVMSLVADNDNGNSFVKIADIIESEPGGLFK